MSQGLSNYCFGCGPANPWGLQLKFYLDGDLCCTKISIPEHFQGYPGIAHGGIVSTIFDELMANHLYLHQVVAMTADLQVRFKKPVPTGKPLLFRSRLLSTGRHRLSELEAWAELDGEVLAQARGKMMLAPFDPLTYMAKAGKGNNRDEGNGIDMQRDEALKLMQANLKNGNLQKHCLAAEAVMRELARHFGEDEGLWGLAGLLHDIDYEETKADPASHSRIGAEKLEKLGLPLEVVYAVKVHNPAHGLPRQSLMDKALYAADPLTGFIVAAALVQPDKKLAKVDVPFLLHRFREKGFARGANREQMQSCEEMGLSLEEFLGLGLKAMQGIAGELGL